MTIKSWSFSRLEVFKTCARQAKHKYIDKAPEPERPYTGKEAANDRGSRIHTAAEDYVLGKRDDLAFELGLFETELNKARSLCSEQKAVAEEMWLYDTNWTVLPADTAYENIWLRVLADLTVWLTPTHMLIVDYKTGKRDGNEVKHGRQLQLYQLAAFLRYPEIDRITCEIWYLDKDELAHQEFTRTQGLRFFRRFNEEAHSMCNEAEYNPRPSQWNCRFCPYGPEETSNKWVNKSGLCKYGV